MAIVPADHGAHRYQFDRPNALPVHRSDRTKDRIRLVLSPELQEFLFQEADSVAVQRCSKQNPCWKFWCPYCAGRRAAKARWQLAPKVDEFEHVFSWVSSTKSEPFISGAWSSHTKVMRAFLQDSWLTRRTSGWLREIHITHGANGWHVHTHWAMFAESRNSLSELEREVEGRWLESARRQGVEAHQRGQRGDVRDDVTGTIKYATKGNMTACTDGNDSIGELWAKYQIRDAEAGAAMVEFQAFFTDGVRRPTRAVGGALRNKKPNFKKTEPVRDLLDIEQDPPIAKSRDYAGTPTDTRSADRREAASRKLHRYDGDPQLVAETAALWAERAAQRRKLAQQHEDDLKRFEYHAAHRAPTQSREFDYLLD